MGADWVCFGGCSRKSQEEGLIEIQLRTATTWVSFKLTGSTCVFKLLRVGALLSSRKIFCAQEFWQQLIGSLSEFFLCEPWQSGFGALFICWGQNFLQHSLAWA